LKLSNEDVGEEKEIFCRYKHILGHFNNELFPATRIYEVVVGPYWGKYGGVAGKWRHIILSMLSLCKLIESSIKLKLPLFKEKTFGLAFDIYCTLINIIRLSKKSYQIPR